MRIGRHRDVRVVLKIREIRVLSDFLGKERVERYSRKRRAVSGSGLEAREMI